MEAEQTSWLQGQNVAITNSDGKYVWHHKPAAKVCTPLSTALANPYLAPYLIPI